MISTMFKIGTADIFYRSEDYNLGWTYDFDQFATEVNPAANGKVHSTLVYWLAQESTDNLDRVYHLAGLIQQREPQIPWDFEGQLLSLEKAARDKKYRNTIFHILGHDRCPDFSNDSAMINFEIRFGQEMDKFDSDQTLSDRLRQKMAYWF